MGLHLFPSIVSMARTQGTSPEAGASDPELCAPREGVCVGKPEGRMAKAPREAFNSL